MVRAESAALEFQADIESAIKEMFFAIAGELEPFDATKPDLRIAANLEKLRDDLLAVVNALFAKLVTVLPGCFFLYRFVITPVSNRSMMPLEHISVWTPRSL